MIDSPDKSLSSTSTSILDNILSAELNGVVTNTFFFKDSVTGAVIGLSNTSPTKAESADALCRMLQSMIIEIRMQFPKIQIQKE